MDFLTIFISLLLVGGALGLVVYPLWQATQFTNQPKPMVQVDERLEDYQTRYEAVLTNIKQLMFDHETGKISTEDYELLLQQTKLEAVKIRQKIDYMQDGVRTATNFALDAKAEMMIKQTRNQASKQDAILAKSVQAELSQLKQISPESIPNTAICPHCQQTIEPNDAFCASCGNILQPTTNPQLTNQAKFCTKCGQTVHPDDAFCVKCGTSLRFVASVGEPTHV